MKWSFEVMEKLGVAKAQLKVKGKTEAFSLKGK